MVLFFQHLINIFLNEFYLHPLWTWIISYDLEYEFKILDMKYNFIKFIMLCILFRWIICYIYHFYNALKKIWSNSWLKHHSVVIWVTMLRHYIPKVYLSITLNGFFSKLIQYYVQIFIAFLCIYLRIIYCKLRFFPITYYTYLYHIIIQSI